jgi:hypothetical protein
LTIARLLWRKQNLATFETAKLVNFRYHQIVAEERKSRGIPYSRSVVIDENHKEAWRAAEKQARSELGDWDWDEFRDDDFGTIERMMKDLELVERLDGRNRDHVAAFTARSTSRSQPTSTPRSTRITTPAISIAIDPAWSVTAPFLSVAATTGTNIGAASAGRTRRPVRAALRHANKCCGVMSCRRATSETTVPGA